MHHFVHLYHTMSSYFTDEYKTRHYRAKNEQYDHAQVDRENVPTITNNPDQRSVRTRKTSVPAMNCLVVQRTSRHGVSYSGGPCIGRVCARRSHPHYSGHPHYINKHLNSAHTRNFYWGSQIPAYPVAPGGISGYPRAWYTSVS